MADGREKRGIEVDQEGGPEAVKRRARERMTVEPGSFRIIRPGKGEIDLDNLPEPRPQLPSPGSDDEE